MAEAEVGDDVFRDDPTILTLEARVSTVGKNIIATTKIRNNYGAIQYCDSNITVLLLVKLSLLILFASFFVSVLCFFFLWLSL